MHIFVQSIGLIPSLILIFCSGLVVAEISFLI